ncbi:MAG: PLDc N-terminal domain-containing protein [Acidimicrobiales bacterium]
MSDWVLLLIVAVPLLLGWLYALVEVALRPDLTAGRRLLWVAVLVLLPVVGLAIYAIVRPPRDVIAALDRGHNPAAERLVATAERRARGEIDSSEYLTEMAKLHPGEWTG